MKTRILLKYLIDNMMDFRYIPVDISRDSNIKLVKNLKQDFENLIIEEKTGDYFEMIGNISKQYRNRKIIMFLGSNLGNYNFNESLDFLTRLSSVMTKNDKLLMGLDLKKDPQLIIKAYDDPYGYTRQFNLNLLERFNREIGSDFNVDNFIHFPDYDPHSGIAKSYLVSTKRQSIHFEEICKELTLYKWEPIYTEMSQKYDDQLIEKLAAHSGFVIEENYYDNNRYFVNTLWRKI
jgi:uncharacterized SAM-dependent methyltransferase